MTPELRQDLQVRLGCSHHPARVAATVAAVGVETGVGVCGGGESSRIFNTPSAPIAKCCGQNAGFNFIHFSFVVVTAPPFWEQRLSLDRILIVWAAHHAPPDGLEVPVTGRTTVVVKPRVHHQPYQFEKNPSHSCVCVNAHGFKTARALLLLLPLLFVENFRSEGAFARGPAVFRPLPP